VLAVDGQDRGTGRARELRQDPAGDDQRLLVGERDALAGGERGVDRRQAGGTDDRADNAVDLGERGELDERLGAGGEPAASGELAGERPCAVAVGHRHAARAQLAREGEELVGAAAERPQADELEALRMMAHDLEAAPADRAGGAEQRQPLPHRGAPPWPLQRSSRRNAGAAKSIASVRSQSPP
jgi:hypothetical protein